MAGHSYMNGGYSNYNDYAPQEGGYFYGQGQNVNWYVVETTTVERVRVPSGGYTSYDGAPFKEYMPKYTPMDHHGGYELDSGSNHEISSPRGYLEQENLMNDFLNKIQIRASRPMKPSNLSSPNRYRPTSPNRYRPTSPDKYRPKSPTHGYPSIDGYPIKGQMQGPTKYRPTSPTKYHPMGPITYRPTSPNKYHPTSPTHNHPPKDVHVVKPQNMPDLNRYRPTSPTKYRPMSPTKYRPTSPTKYRPTSPSKYRPTNPIGYRHTSPTKYQPTSPTHNYPSKEDNPIKGQETSGWNKYMPTSPVLKFPPKEIQPIRAQRFSSPNKQHPSSPRSGGGQYDRLGDFSSPDTPKTQTQLTSPTNNINEALDHLAQTVYHSPRSEPKRDGVFNNLFSRAQPTEHEGKYGKPTLGRAKGFFRSNAIDSEEAVKKYNGANVP